MSNKKEPVWIAVLRILLAVVFLFSSVTKAVDPVNFGIKMDEYFMSFGMGFMHPLSQFIAVCAITCEFLLGCMMLLRIKMQWTSLFYLLFMAFFFLLTLWLAAAEYLEVHGIHDFGVVKDCGCFGQAVQMTNLQTFLKNVAIIIPTIIVYTQRKRIPDIRMTGLGQGVAVALLLILAVLFQMHCIRHLPAVDFTDWKKGNEVASVFIDEPALKESVFIYQNKDDSSKVELTEDELMEKDETFYNDYNYTDRRDKVIREMVRAQIDGFTMLDADGRDYAYDVLNSGDKYVYILFMANLDEADPRGIALANALAADCRKEGITFAAVTNTPQEEIPEFAEKHAVGFPIYCNPINPVKGPFMVRDAVRSNPGLILFRQGVVVDKWAWRDIPSQALYRGGQTKKKKE